MTAPETSPASAPAQCCSLGSGPLSSADAEHYASLFGVLAEPARLRLLSRLAAQGCGPLTVSELTESSGLSQPTVSHHLKRLAEAGLVEKTRDGRRVMHRIISKHFAELRTVLTME